MLLLAFSVIIPLTTFMIEFHSSLTPFYPFETLTIREQLQLYVKTCLDLLTRGHGTFEKHSLEFVDTMRFHSGT
jgi:hypothetical protein